MTIRVFFGMAGALALLLAGAKGVQAVPIQLNSAQFSSEISGLITQVEDFESEATGVKSSPYTFANGTYSTSTLIGSDGYIHTGGLFCGTSPDQCLTNMSITGVKTIDALPSETTYWGVDMYYIDPSNPFRVTVNGGSGVLSIVQTGTSFFGFKDILGINSLTFENLGTNQAYGNYSFDNVTTAQNPVPEPSTYLLLGTGFVGLLGLKRSRRKKN